MESKTLKDLNKHDGSKYFEWEVGNQRVFFESELKKEMIKWVKEFQIERTKAISEMFNNVDRYGIYPTTKFFNRIDNFWIKKFNLIGDDLE